MRKDGKTTITLARDELLEIVFALDEMFTQAAEAEGFDDMGGTNIDPATDERCQEIDRVRRKVGRAISRTRGGGG